MLLRFRQDVIALQPNVVVILAGTSDRGSMQATFRGCFSQDASQLMRSEGADLSLQMRLSSKEGVSIDAKLSQKQDAVWRGTGN